MLQPSHSHALGSTHVLATFADCANLALILAEDFDHVHVAALTSADGNVLDGVVLSEPGHSLDHCVGYGLALVPANPATAALTFLSVAHGAGRLRDADVASWRRTLDVADGDPRCRDWMITDGGAIRSMAVTTGRGWSWRQ